MNTEGEQKQSPEGPPAYGNWLAALNDEPAVATREYPLLSDASVTGEIREGFGPYQFLNPVPLVGEPGLVRPVIFLRVKIHVEYSTPDMKTTDSELYHGGSLTDEIAALSSLALGIRLKAGGMSRIFDLYGDPLGRPIARDRIPDPLIIIRNYNLILPSAVGSHPLDKIEPLKLFSKLKSDDAIVLIRAARLYQDALWIAESEPSLSWVMLVSAVEAAASYWRSKEIRQ